MERRIGLEGCFNFRDLGGYPTRDGRRVRWRRLFRSDGLQQLTDRDVARLRDELRLASIVDLRSTLELEQDGRGRLAQTAISFHHVPFFDGARTAERPPPEKSLGELYVGMIERAADPIARAIRVLAETPADRSAVYHCAAGKDRTGVLSALLLSLLGVDDELIIADYALSQESMERVFARLEALRGYDDMWKELPPDTMHARPETMKQLLGTIADRHGGVAGFVESIGVAPREIELLRERSLERTPA